MSYELRTGRASLRPLSQLFDSPDEDLAAMAPDTSTKTAPLLSLSSCLST